MKEITDVKKKKTYEIDQKDREILNILVEDGRTKLTDISKKINLGIDSTKLRIEKMKEAGIIDKFTIHLNVSKIGLPFTAHIYLKLKDYNEGRVAEFKKYMISNSRVIVFMTMIGDYDTYAVIIAKDAHEMNSEKNEIRKLFSDIIGDWKEVIVAEIYKLEEYKL